MDNRLTLKNKVAVVTGSSRSIGKGIALVLGALGAIVYVTGRTREVGEHALPGTIVDTAETITLAGGVGIAVACDHADDQQARALFDRVRAEQGHLDILVNNVTALATDILNPPPFWTKSLHLADQIMVGLRSAYVATYYAAPLLLASEKALVVNISYYGAVSYHLDPAYGAAKAGLDKMTWDMALDFREHGVAVVSVWPGPTTTELAVSLLSQTPGGDDMMEQFETPAFTGRVVAALYADPNLLAKSGQVVIGAEAGIEYEFKDVNGNQPPSLREQLGEPRSYFTTAHN